MHLGHRLAADARARAGGGDGGGGGGAGGAAEGYDCVNGAGLHFVPRGAPLPPQLLPAAPAAAALLKLLFDLTSLLVSV